MGQDARRRPPGQLEADVMAVLWSSDRPLTPTDVERRLGGSLARTTVATILARLHGKGVAARVRGGRAFVYTAAHDAAGLVARRMRWELDRGQDRSSALKRFVCDLGTDDVRLLRALLDDTDGPQ